MKLYYFGVEFLKWRFKLLKKRVDVVPLEFSLIPFEYLLFYNILVDKFYIWM